MAHPTIDIISEPSIDCPNPVYNCVKYCFQANDYQTATGTKATFSIEMPASVTGYNTGFLWTIAGQPYTTINGFTGGVPSHNEIPVIKGSDGGMTPAQFAIWLKAALEFNQYIYCHFTIEIVGDAVVATARNEGALNDFVFDFAAVPMLESNTNGTNDTYRDNYRLVLEIWECESDELSQKISQEAYIPDADGSFCVNIGLKVSSLLETLFPFDLNPNISWYNDLTIIKNIALRYGESYSDVVDECEVSARDFVNSDCIRVINSAFQREENAQQYQDMCEGQFMTNMPDFTQVCEDSLVYLWANLFDIWIIPAPPDTLVHPFIEFFYTDGSSSIHITTNFTGANPNKIFSIGFGPQQILFLADPLKTVDYYRCRIVVRYNPVPVPTGDTYYSSQYFKLISCCDSSSVEFYFLNEFGGYDTILFNQVDSIELQQSNSVFESFLDCDDETALRAGKDIIDINANDVYTVTSKFLDNYQTRRWLREFLTSPKKYVRTLIKTDENEILSKVIVLDSSFTYLNNDDNFILIRLSYVLNESINLHNN